MTLPWDPEQRMYVWFDALLNYYTALSFAREGEDLTDRYWPATLHVMAKDIIKFHAVIWPALLMAAELPLPRGLYVHGYLLMDDKKMSKSLGNVLDPFEVIERFGSDALRFYCFREVSFGQDGSISPAGFEARYETELANDFGNLASRTLAMIDRYRDGVVPDGEVDPALREGDDGLGDLRERVCALLDGAEITRALEEIWGTVRRLNRYVEETKPWELAKDESASADLDRVLYNLAEGLRVRDAPPRRVYPELRGDAARGARARRELGSPTSARAAAAPGPSGSRRCSPSSTHEPPILPMTSGVISGSGPALAISGLRKRFGAKDALGGVDLEVGAGQLVGLLGPNGAGKTTLTKIACGLAAPSAGTVEVMGAPAGSLEARSRTGYLAELFRFPGWLSADELLEMHQKLTGSAGATAERGELLELVGLGDARAQRVETMSKGMQQRLGIAQALIGSPRLLLLDEPTSALDPGGRRIVRGLLEEVRSRGIAVLLNSHLLSEVERVCDSVTIIAGGVVVASGRSSELGRSGGVEVDTDRGLERFDGVERDGIPQLVADLVDAGRRIYAVRETGTTLEDAYLEAVGEETR